MDPSGELECGWRTRLGTKMIVNAIVLLNKLLLLPDSHPIQKLVSLSLYLLLTLWVQRVLQLMKDESLDNRIPFLHECECFSLELIALPKTDTAVRRNLVKKYKRH